MQSYINTKKNSTWQENTQNVEETKRGHTSSLQESVIIKTKHVPHTPRSSRSWNSVQGVPAWGELGACWEVIDGAFGGVDLEGICLPFIVSLVVGLDAQPN